MSPVLGEGGIVQQLLQDFGDRSIKSRAIRRRKGTKEGWKETFLSHSRHDLRHLLPHSCKRDSFEQSYSSIHSCMEQHT
jgi:hypothetical protein